MNALDPRSGGEAAPDDSLERIGLNGGSFRIRLSHRLGWACALPFTHPAAELEGESAVKLWREHRGLTQQELARRAEISKSYLSQIETGKRQGMAERLNAIARALDVPLDVLAD